MGGGVCARYRNTPWRIPIDRDVPFLLPSCLPLEEPRCRSEPTGTPRGTAARHTGVG